MTVVLRRVDFSFAGFLEGLSSSSSSSPSLGSEGMISREELGRVMGSLRAEDEEVDGQREPPV